MYAGRVVEHTDAGTLYAHPGHPYTRGLMDSVPRVDDAAGAALQPIPGLPPSLSAIPNGCPFHPRCAHAQDVCVDEVPPLRELPGNDGAAGHQAACHFAERFVAEGPDRPTTHEVVSR